MPRTICPPTPASAVRPGEAGAAGADAISQRAPRAGHGWRREDVPVKEPEAKFFVVSTADASATVREIEAELRECGVDASREGADDVRYFQPPRSAAGEVYIAERAAHLLEERGLRPGILRYAVPAHQVPKEALRLAASADPRTTTAE